MYYCWHMQRVENVPLRIQAYHDFLNFGVMDLPHIDIILGQEWLFSKDPIISFRHHTVELEHNGSLHKLVGEKGLPNFPIVTLDDKHPSPRWHTNITSTFWQVIYHGPDFHLGNSSIKECTVHECKLHRNYLYGPKNDVSSIACPTCRIHGDKEK